MSHDELIEELAREHRYRNVLVAAAVIGVIASAIVGIMFTIGPFDLGRPDRTALGMLGLPFAVSMVIGGGIHKVLLARGRRRR